MRAQRDDQVIYLPRRIREIDGGTWRRENMAEMRNRLEQLLDVKNK